MERALGDAQIGNSAIDNSRISRLDFYQHLHS